MVLKLVRKTERINYSKKQVGKNYPEKQSFSFFFSPSECNTLPYRLDVKGWLLFFLRERSAGRPLVLRSLLTEDAEELDSRHRPDGSRKIFNLLR